jgi:hypothetical protein
MQRNMYTDDFEKLIRQKADQYKMYPSDQVWKGVYKSLHGRKRWRWAGLAILLLGIGIYTGNYYLSGKPAARLAKNMEPSISAASDFRQAPNQAPISAVPSRWLTGNNANSAARTTTSSTTTGITATQQQEAVQPNSNLPAQQQQQLALTTFPVQQQDIAIVAASKENTLVITNGAPTGIPAMRSLVTAEETINTSRAGANKLADEARVEEKTENTAAEKLLAGFADASSESVLEEKQKGVNWLQDYAVFQLTAKKVQRLGLQLHFSPTVNYRKLSGKSYYPR